jgi:transcriptional regulator with XRE-family HTH domain
MPAQSDSMAARKYYVRHVRDLLNLTQEQFGQRLGLSLDTISRWETGATTIPPWRMDAVRQLEIEHWKGKRK